MSLEHPQHMSPERFQPVHGRLVALLDELKKQPDFTAKKRVICELEGNIRFLNNVSRKYIARRAFTKIANECLLNDRLARDKTVTMSEDTRNILLDIAHLSVFHLGWVDVD